MSLAATGSDSALVLFSAIALMALGGVIVIVIATAVAVRRRSA